VSPRGKDSASRSVADTLAARLADLYPSAKLMRRDRAAKHLPHLDEITLRAISTTEPAAGGEVEAGDPPVGSTDQRANQGEA
jgi:FMN-dependent NADH-azoreductase